MTSKGVSKLIRQLTESQLLTPAQLEELNSFPATRSDDFQALARDIYKKGWLTRYQLNEIANGRGRDLSIGSYRVLDLIGQGGMGQVFKAQHQVMGRVVALKVIRKERLGNENALKRFEREVRTAAQLSHPNIVVAFDAGIIGNKFFYAMEFLDGIDLAGLLAKSGPLPVAQACDFVRQAALGLQYAHECGMVHRDIKPHNLVATRLQGPAKSEANRATVIKILDLGLARFKGTEEAASVTQDGQGLGTPAYLAPEQARNARNVDIRADIYALGCTFYHLLTGTPPFRGEIAEVLLKHQTEEPPAIESLRPAVPPAIVAIVRKMMAKKADDRYATPKAVADLLEPRGGAGAGSGESDLNWTTLLPSSSETDTPNSKDLLNKTVTNGQKKTASHGTLATMLAWPRSSRKALALTVGVAGVLILGAALVALNQLSRPVLPKDPGGLVKGPSDPGKNGGKKPDEGTKKGEKPGVGVPPPAGSGVQILDNASKGFSKEGAWTKVTGAGYTGGEALEAEAAKVDSKTQARWEFTDLSRGKYHVSATWESPRSKRSTKRSTKAPFAVLDGKVVLGKAELDQSYPPSDKKLDNRMWQALGEFLVTGNSLTVRLSAAGDGAVEADAVRLEKIGELPPGPRVQVLDEAGVVGSSNAKISFDRTGVGKPQIKEFIVRSTGTEELEIKSVEVSKFAAGIALSAKPNVPQKLTPGAATRFSVVLEAKSRGNYGGSVSITTNDPVINPFTFNVDGVVQP